MAVEESAHYLFSGPSEIHEFDALLFDMDGTIIDSTPAVIQCWTRVGQDIGVDPAVILATSHGRRTIDVLAEHDPSKANWDYVLEMESKIPILYGSSAVELQGSRAAISILSENAAPWAIVTSGSNALVSGWLKVLNIPAPQVLVTAQDVKQGKPAPDGYKLAMTKLFGESNLKGKRVLVLEDAPAGIASGKAAGCKVIGLGTSHTIEEIQGTQADWIIKNLDSLNILEWDSVKRVIKVEIKNNLIRR